MKNPKRLTVAQREYLKSMNIIAENWFITKCTSDEWEIVHKLTNQRKVVPAP